MAIGQEEQELRLTVTLDNRAEQQLARLEQSLRSLATYTGGGSQGAAHHMRRFSESLRSSRGPMAELEQRLLGMGARASSIVNSFRTIGGAIGVVALAVVKIMQEADKLSRAMVGLDRAARRARAVYLQECGLGSNES